MSDRQIEEIPMPDSDEEKIYDDAMNRLRIRLGLSKLPSPKKS